MIIQLLLIFLGNLIFGSLSLTVLKAPQNATRKTGDTVLFQCTVDGPDTGSFEWQSYSSIPQDRIYSLNPNSTNPLFPPEKFQPVDVFNLNITDLNWRDGTKYGCYHFSIGKIRVANLFVLDKQVINISPPTVKMNTPSEFTCEVHFGGPQVNPSVDQFPKLSMFLEAEELTNRSVLVYTKGEPGTSLHVISLTYNYTVLNSDVNKVLQCVVSTRNPDFMDSVNATLNIEVAAYDVTIFPNKTSFEVGDVINCSAKGLPTPNINWIKNSSSDVTSPVGSMLRISPTMVGLNTWKCIATNIWNESPAFKDITFNVLESSQPPYSSDMDNGSNGKKIGVAVGVTVGLLIVAAIIIVLFFVFKKRRGKQDVESAGKRTSPSYQEMSFVVNSQQTRKEKPAYNDPDRDGPESQHLNKPNDIDGTGDKLPHKSVQQNDMNFGHADLGVGNGNVPSYVKRSNEKDQIHKSLENLKDDQNSDLNNSYDQNALEKPVPEPTRRKKKTMNSSLDQGVPPNEVSFQSDSTSNDGVRGKSASRSVDI